VAVCRKGWMHGIEVFNEKEWYPEALQWALDKNLAITGNSDIHDVYNRRYVREQYPIRPVTLVFAKERTEASLKEAMFARRTATLFFDRLIGPEAFVMPLVNRSIVVSEPFLYQDGYIYLEAENRSDITFTLVKEGIDESGIPARTTLPRRSKVIVRVKQPAGKAVTYSFRLENVLIGVEKMAEFSFVVK